MITLKTPLPMLLLAVPAVYRLLAMKLLHRSARLE